MTIKCYEPMPASLHPMWKPENPPAGPLCADEDVRRLEEKYARAIVALKYLIRYVPVHKEICTDSCCLCGLQEAREAIAEGRAE